MSSSDRPDYVRQNVANWTEANAQYTDAAAGAACASDEIAWGARQKPESELNVLGDVSGLDIVELGCGTAYFSAWLARRGARVVGVDPTPAQLETARRLQRETGIEFPLIEAIGEDVPLPDNAFDIVHSEYGAAIWADPYKWIPEAARLVRPGGRLIFLCNSPLSMLCMTMESVGEQLVRPQLGMQLLRSPGPLSACPVDSGQCSVASCWLNYQQCSYRILFPAEDGGSRGSYDETLRTKCENHASP